MKFDHYQLLMKHVLESSGQSADILPPERMHPLVLAYIGDAYYTLYVRSRLLAYEQNRVRVLHAYGSKIVSAAMQACALRSLEAELTETELAIVRRGRNAKSTPTKNASVSDYRYGTGFEALVGYLLLTENYSRLTEIVEKGFLAVMRKLNENEQE